MAKKLYEEQNIYDIACAIREKCGEEKAKFKTCDMADAIRDLEIGEGGGTDLSNISFGNTVGAYYMFACSIWNPFIDEFGDQLNINVAITDSMFQTNNLIEDASSLTFNVHTSSLGYVRSGHEFDGCHKLKELPTIKGDWVASDLQGTFNECYSLKTIPAKFFRYFDGEYMQNNKPVSNPSYSSSFYKTIYKCYSLRSFPVSIFANDYKLSTSSCYWGYFYDLYAIDELTDLPIPYTSALSGKTIKPMDCERLSEFTFSIDETDEDNPVPLQVNWSNITLDLTNRIGYGSIDDFTTLQQYSNDFSEDNRVTSALTYEELKDDKDWWTTDENFSRYNHDSAVNTINSLPDTTSSATGGNVVKFTSGSGAATDGGPISALTESEIAVAAIKGWTVTLVD